MGKPAFSPAEQIAQTLKRIYDKGLTTSSGGNISVLDDAGRLFITPGGKDKATLSPENIVCVDTDGNICNGKPSVEMPIHKAIYASMSRIKAIIHAHPPALNAFSIIGRLPNTRIMPLTARLCCKSSIAPYACPGTDELAQVISKEFTKGSEIVLMQNHGLIIGCESLSKAYDLLETLDLCAQIELSALVLGDLITLTDMQIENYTAFIPKTSKMPAIPGKAGEELINYTRRAYRQGLFTSKLGAFSIRIDADSFITTADNADVANLSMQDIVLVKRGIVSDLPQQYWRTHAEVYKRHPEAQSIATAHSPAVMAFSATRTAYDTHLIPESYTLLREVPIVPFGTVLSEPERVAEMLSMQAPLIISQNECAVVLGKSALNAFDKLEVAEFCGRSIIQAKQLGNIIPIGKEHFEDILRMLPC